MLLTEVEESDEVGVVRELEAIVGANNGGNKMQFPEKPKFSVSFESKDEKLSPLINVLNTLEHEEWDITPIMMIAFSDLPLKEQMKIINEMAFEKAKKGIDV